MLLKGSAAFGGGGGGGVLKIEKLVRPRIVTFMGLVTLCSVEVSARVGTPSGRVAHTALGVDRYS